MQFVNSLLDQVTFANTVHHTFYTNVLHIFYLIMQNSACTDIFCQHQYVAEKMFVWLNESLCFQYVAFSFNQLFKMQFCD